MKVTKEENTAFTPITITLESQLEVDVLRQMCGKIAGGGDVRVFTTTLYTSLFPYSPLGKTYFRGDYDLHIMVDEI